MRTEPTLPQRTFVKLCAIGALAIALPIANAAADTPAPGGFTYDDPDEPSVFADGSTLAAPAGQLLGGVVDVHGTLAGSHPGDGVTVQQLDSAGAWTAVATATVAPDGSFDVTWRPTHSGHTTLRAVPASTATTVTAPRATATTSAIDVARPITVFHPVQATWYGPGFYGRRTACGRRMTTTLLGVAHRTLPCGTLVELYRGGRTITVPVVDRGPFRHGTTYDLTAAAAKVLGMTTTSTVGVVRAQPAPAPAPVAITPAAPAAPATGAVSAS